MHQKIKFIPMKIHKTVTTRAAPFGPDMHQIVCRTPLGELTALPQSLYLNYGGLLLRGVKGVGRGELRPPFLKFLDLPLYKEGD